ncbi:MAG: hypothetical protein MJB14_02530 [Spirochaetes bacterium]|nr:hypothetical protein [Spirochaetota bacterium]
MKYYLHFLLFVFLLSPAFTESKINVDELKIDEDIVFENYQGEYEYVESIAQIQGIGKRLARGIRRKKEFKISLKYSIIHAVDNQEDERNRLNADILSIDADAKVDHIRNIRLILASYLQTQYQYSSEDAKTLAFFITIYNASYRGSYGYFKVKYKDIVIQHISPENAGISTKYHEWPGKTKIIIPLTDSPEKGNLSSLSTTDISDEKVVSKLREEDDRSIEEREQLTDLKEREVEQQKKEIDQSRDEISTKKDQIAEKEKEIDQKQEEIDKIEKTQKKERLQTKLDKEKEELDQEKEQVQQEEEKLAKTEEQVKEKETEIEEDKDLIEQDTLEIALEEDPEKAKELLAQKEKELKEKQEELENREESLKDIEADKQIFANKMYFLKINEYLAGGHYENDMYILDPETEDILLKSPEKNISGRKYDVISEGVIVITHKGQHTTGTYLTLLDRNTLEAKKISSAKVFWRSSVEVREDIIYVVMTDGQDYYLAAFNTDMEMIKKTQRRVYPDTFISIYKDSIYVNSERSTILIFNKADLSLKKEITEEELTKWQTENGK